MKDAGYVDGVITPLSDARLPILDRGFLYGDSVYEVFRTYDGIAFMFDEHFARLQHSAKLIGLAPAQSKQQIIRAIRDTLDFCENRERRDVYVRFQITRGGGAVDLFPADDLKSVLVIIVKALPQWNPEHYKVGLRAAVTATERNPVSALDPNIKGGNYLNNILALREARELGADECVMLDARGIVTECSNSNIWFAFGDEITAPKHGNLVGLTRRKLLELWRADARTAHERNVFANELSRARECFVTSTTREIMPVAQLRLRDGGAVEFPPGGGEVTRRAQKLYADMLEEFIRANRNAAWF